MSKRTLLNLLVVLFLLLPSLTAQAAPPMQGGNLLTNGDFEARSSSGDMPAGWAPWWIASNCKPTGNSLAYSCTPNGFYQDTQKSGGSPFIHSGQGSMTINNNWDPWTAGVKQAVSAPPGARVRLTAYGHLWAAGKEWSSKVTSDTGIGAVSKVGLDPNGTDYPTNESQVIWSGTASPHDTWVPFTVEATVGASGRVQVILYTSYTGFSTYYMSASWDDAVLTVIDPGSGAPSAPGAPTAQPTSPPVVKLPPFVLPTPLADGSVVYIVQPGDSLWRIAANTGKTIDEIKAMNGLTSNVLTAGQRIIVGQGATATPAPTIAPTEDVQAAAETASAPPATAESPVATAPPAGTTEICALLYEDINGNGQQDADEAAIATGQLAILDANTGAPLQAYTTKPEDANGHCFKDLPPGTYTVAATAPAGYNPTTATSVLRQADAGLHYKLQFGAQLGSRAVSGVGSKSNLRTALFGAAGVVFLLLAAGIGGFLMLRRR